MKQELEENKLNYLKDFVDRTNSNVEKLVRDNISALHSIAFSSLVEDRINSWEFKGLTSICDLIEMYILDGCFIIELFLKNDNKLGKADALLSSEWVLCALSRDLILLDNQLPFSVLIVLWKHWWLSEWAQDDGDHHHLKSITKLASNFLKRIVPNQELKHNLVNTEIRNRDLTSLVYDGLNWSLTHKADDNYNSNIDKDNKDGDALLVENKEDGDDKWNLVKSATELEVFGVKIKKIDMDNFIDIKFTKKRVLEIPRICIRYGTSYCIKILLEYEQSRRKERHLNDYLLFMNSLIKSPSDVQLLREKGIIDNLSELRDDAAIFGFFNNLYASLQISLHDFNNIQVCKGLNSHCNHRRYTWIPKLKRDYCNSPWTVISVFAASLLLVLTVVQTIFSITSYYN